MDTTPAPTPLLLTRRDLTRPDTQTTVDDLAHVLDIHLSRIGIDTATIAGAAMTVAMLAAGVDNTRFWSDLADVAEQVSGHYHGSDVPADVRRAVVARYCGYRDALIDVAMGDIDAYDALHLGDGGVGV